MEQEREMIAWQELAIAVIMQAWIDALHWRDSYNRQSARRFLTGQTKAWQESLESWCALANKDPKRLQRAARIRFSDEHKRQWDRKKEARQWMNGMMLNR